MKCHIMCNPSLYMYILAQIIIVERPKNAVFTTDAAERSSARGPHNLQDGPSGYEPRASRILCDKLFEEVTQSTLHTQSQIWIVFRYHRGLRRVVPITCPHDRL